jgi:hypothetical protein
VLTGTGRHRQWLPVFETWLVIAGIRYFAEASLGVRAGTSATATSLLAPMLLGMRLGAIMYETNYSNLNWAGASRRLRFWEQLAGRLLRAGNSA